MLSFIWKNGKLALKAFFDVDIPKLHQLRNIYSDEFQYVRKQCCFPTEIDSRFDSESTLHSFCPLHAFFESRSTLNSFSTLLNVFPSKFSTGNQFRQYDYEDTLSQRRYSLLLAALFILLYYVWYFVVFSGHRPVLSIVFISIFFSTLYLSPRLSRCLRARLKTTLALPRLPAFLFFVQIAFNVFEELHQEYDGHCDNNSYNCPCIAWSPSKVIARCIIIFSLNNHLCLSFHHALLESMLCWIILIPTLFPWFERQDESSGIKYQVNRIDKSVLIGVAVCFLATVLSLRQGYQREFWRRVSFIQIKKLDAYRRLIEIQLSSRLPLKFQQPERYSLESSLEEFPLVTLLVCRFSTKEDGNAFSPKNFLSLTECYLAFDQLVVANGFYKVLQVGQEYIVSSPNVYHGSESDDHNSAGAAQQAALGLLRLGHLLLQVGQNITSANGRTLNFSAALHSGPLLGGICGKNERTYRLFGPIMDKALEICQSCDVCTVKVSAATKELLDGSGVQFVNLEEENISRESTVQLSDSFLVEASQPMLSSSDHLDISSLVEDDVVLEDTADVGLVSTEQENEEFQSDWLQELLRAAQNTLNHSRGVFKNHRVESEFNLELQRLRMHETKIYFKTLVVFYIMYFCVLYCAWIPDKQDADTRWWPPVTVGVSCAFSTWVLLRRIGGSFWSSQMHHAPSEQSRHLEMYSWIGFALAAGAFLVQLCLSNTPFAFLGLGLYCFIRPDTRLDYPHVVIGSVCVMLSSMIAYMFYEKVYDNRLGTISIFAQMWLMAIYMLQKRFYKINLRVVWLFGKTLERKREECQWLLAESIPSKEALDFVVENQLCHVKNGVTAKPACMTHNCTHATILNICIVNYASLLSTLDAIDVVCSLDFVFKTVDTLINENSKLNSVCNPSNQALFKIIGSASQCQVVELLLDPSSSEKIKSIYRMLQFASEAVSSIETYRHEKDHSLGLQLKLGLGVGEVAVGAIGFVQPTLLVFGESLRNSSLALLSSEMNCIQLCSNSLTLLAEHDTISKRSTVDSIDLSMFLHPTQRPSCSLIKLELVTVGTSDC